MAAEKVGQVNFSEYSFATFFTTGGAVAHQQGHLRLLNPKDLSDLCLRQAAVLEDRMNLQRELRLEQLLLGIGKAEGPEDVSATFSYAGDSLGSFSRFGFPFGARLSVDVDGVAVRVAKRGRFQREARFAEASEAVWVTCCEEPNERCRLNADARAGANASRDEALDPEGFIRRENSVARNSQHARHDSRAGQAAGGRQRATRDGLAKCAAELLRQRLTIALDCDRRQREMRATLQFAHFEDPDGNLLYIAELDWGHVNQGEGKYQHAQ